jgi:hypothetical protein
MHILNDELVCKVCRSAEVVTCLSHGRRYKRPYCRVHWNAYCVARNKTKAANKGQQGKAS